MLHVGMIVAVRFFLLDVAQGYRHHFGAAGRAETAPQQLFGWDAVCAIAADIGMASMLNSTAKQAIQAIASRCRDMGQIRWVGDQARLFSLIRADK